jgi:hypothetical protein
MMTGSDGDLKFLSSQKKLLKFGSFCEYGDMQLAGDLDSDYLANQDPLHILKKLKNFLLDPGSNLTLGPFCAMSGLFIVMMKRFDFKLHNLTQTDLDYRDRMNYK